MFLANLNILTYCVEFLGFSSHCFGVGEIVFECVVEFAQSWYSHHSLVRHKGSIVWGSSTQQGCKGGMMVGYDGCWGPL